MLCGTNVPPAGLRKAAPDSSLLNKVSMFVQAGEVACGSLLVLLLWGAKE